MPTTSRREDGALRSMLMISLPIAARLGAGPLRPWRWTLAHWGARHSALVAAWALAGAGCPLARSVVNLTPANAAVKDFATCGMGEFDLRGPLTGFDCMIQSSVGRTECV